MELTVYPGHSLSGTYGPDTQPGLPGDKSISHRAALFAGMATGQSKITNFMVSGVTKVLLESLAHLGVNWELHGTTLLVDSPGFRAWKTPTDRLDCGNSGTTMRLLAGALAAAGIGAVLDGSEGLRRRPMARIIQPLQQMGVPISGTTTSTAPLTLQPRPDHLQLHPINYDLPVPSAQVKTCILLAALDAPGRSILQEHYRSRDHTELMYISRGVDLASYEQPGPYENRIEIDVTTDQILQPADLEIPGDFSSAAFLIVASLITPGSTIKLTNIGLNPTRTGLLDVLSAMGARISLEDQPGTDNEPRGDLEIRHSNLHATTVAGRRVVRMIDEFPILAVAAAYSSGTTQVREAEELRYKESDRISALCAELKKIGVQVEEYRDGFSITGQGHVPGGKVVSHRDHRLALSLGVAGLASRQPVSIQEAEMIRESFPAFPDLLQHAGARLDFA